MSSVTQTSAVVLRGDYNNESRKHPVLAFFEEINKHFDSRQHEGYEDLYAADYSYHSTDGEQISHERGFHEQHSFKRAASRYYMDPLVDHKHYNEEVVAFDAGENKSELIWVGLLYAQVRGEPGTWETKVKDPNGREWDARVPVTYHFSIVKDPSAKHGHRIAGVKIFEDTHVIREILDKREHGHLKPGNN